MTKEPAKTEATESPKLPELTIDTPFTVVLHRTPSRDNYKQFIGDKRLEEAEAFASQIAARGGTAFLCPPTKVFTPPKEPVVEVSEVNFG